MPAGVPPHKPAPFSPARHRSAMLKAALKGNPFFTLRQDEMKRGGISYTIDTILDLRASHPGTRFYYIIGSDNLSEIPGWHRFTELLDLIVLCVAYRPGHSPKPPRELKNVRILPFPSPNWGVSSSMVRSYIQNGYSCRYLVPDRVLDYIGEHGLYRRNPPVGLRPTVNPHGHPWLPS